MDFPFGVYVKTGGYSKGKSPMGWWPLQGVFDKTFTASELESQLDFDGVQHIPIPKKMDGVFFFGH